MGRTLAQKIWDAHLVHRSKNEPDLLYIDLHMLYEVTSVRAFEGLRAAGRTVRRPDLTLATEDHTVPTVDILKPIVDLGAREQVRVLRANCAEFGVELYALGDQRQGIVHVIAPEQGLAHPGMTIVCCDSHTTTQGAFGALAFGIGTSQAEQVLATQTLMLQPLKNMAITVNGELPSEVTAKDLILAVIEKIGTAGAQGHIVEYRGSAIEQLSMEARMTVCNMTVEAGSRAGLIAPDETTFEYLRGRPHVPSGGAFDDEVAYWRTLRSDDDAEFDTEIVLDASTLSPYVSWGTNPGQSTPLRSAVPDPQSFSDPTARAAARRALEYMGLKPGTPLRDIEIDTVFIGSCTNSRIEDLRAAAQVLAGRKIAPGVNVLVVPGSERVREQAVAEGLDRILSDAGTELRHAGCSMCAALNEDRLLPGQRAASTNNRNFEGRQGRGSRTHIVSPSVAAASAVAGRLAAPSDLEA